MTERKLSAMSVLSLCAAAFLLVGSIFLPWWGMKFFAPQYPEGLDIIVYPYKLAGQIDIVNGLNHYIGMQGFSEETFPELQYLPYLVAGMALLTLIAAFLRKKGPLYALLVLFILGGVAGIYDMNRWLTTFGTNLDPKAPIKVPPFVPPILGSNQLANFVTHSYFTYGAYLLGLSFLLLLLPLWWERKNAKS